MRFGPPARPRGGSGRQPRHQPSATSTCMHPDPCWWRNRSVLVTGCTGFLGGWLSGWLVEAGANVDGLVRDAVPHSRFIREGIASRVSVVRGRVEDRGLLERVLGEHEVE